MVYRQALLTREWKTELDKLIAKTGVTLEDICAYLGLSYSGDIRFYSKVPRKKSVFIGIGMAFKLTLDEINRWIVKYGDKRRLYIKDVPEDLIWIYLINANARDTESDINYYNLYEDAKDKAIEVYNQVWDEYIRNGRGTASMDYAIKEVEHDEGFRNLRAFVVENMDGFKTAYSKSRAMLARYVNAILGGYTRNGRKDIKSLNSLRGYLDDSMINYLSGDIETINVTDLKSGERTVNIKAVPKGKKTHISICLALGMAVDEINDYLSYLGYAMLDDDIEEEKNLKKRLGVWNETHELQRRYKDRYIYGNTDAELTPSEELQAVNDMLMLRQDIREECMKAREYFPYMKG